MDGVLVVILFGLVGSLSYCVWSSGKQLQNEMQLLQNKVELLEQATT